jgi:tripartite-type tricarboxylate transporter receptor subunit TctC
MRSKIFVGTVLATISLLYAPTVFSQPYPNKTVRVVVAWPPGGAADVVARPIAQKLTEALGQQFVVDNRGGATGTIGAGAVAKAQPDGYTLLLGTTNELCMSPPLYTKLPYDPTSDFAPISTIIVYPNVLVVNPALPISTAKEFIALAKARPGQVSFASGGQGSTNHLTIEVLKSLTKIKVNHVPYKGGGPALTDVIGGHVEALFATLPSALGHVRAGKLKALVVTSDKRARLLPEVPSATEAGIPGLIVTTWSGLLAPAGTPRDIMAKLNDELIKIAHSQDMKPKLEALAADVYTNSPEEFAALIRRDFAMWARVVKESGTKLD